MAGFKIDNFGGVIPRMGARLLPTKAAQLADNAKLFSGELTSWHRPTTVATPNKSPPLKSMYRMYDTSSVDYWLSWADDVDVVKGPIAGDTQFKLYYTGDTTTGTNYQAGPRKTNLLLANVGGTDYPHDWLEMGVPAPGATPTVIGTGGTSTNSVTRVYIYTYVTGTDAQGGLWAEEGPPSPPGTGTGKADATWVIANLSTGTTGKYAFGAATKRIYRTLTDNAGNTNYQLALDAVPIASTSTNDTVADGSLGVICPSFTLGVVGSQWVGPPSDLTNIIALPNGIMAGFSGNLICFCEPYFPHAWPVRYQLAVTYKIVSLGAYGQTLIVTTKGFPFAVTGARPDSMAMARIEENHPCVSKRGTVSFPWGVMWPTPDGLALAGVGGAVNVIEPFMKRDEWQALCFPGTIVARQYLDVYFAFFNTGSQGRNFIFDRTNQEGPLVFGNYAVDGVWNDVETMKLYLSQNGNIKLWDSDTINLSPFDWRSKVFVFPKPVNFGAAQVEADYSSLIITTESAAQIAADTSINAAIIGTANHDTAGLTAWAATASYGTGTVVKSVDNVKMAVCMVAGTSGTLEPTWPNTLGGSATDGTVHWKQVWEVQGVTRGAVNEFPIGYYNQISATDPYQIGSSQNGWGFPIAGSLLVGGFYPNFEDRSVTLQAYATTTAAEPSLVWAQNVTDRSIIRLPKGEKSDTWEFRISGNVVVRYFKVAETATELAQVGALGQQYSEGLAT